MTITNPLVFTLQYSSFKLVCADEMKPIVGTYPREGGFSVHVGFQNLFLDGQVVNKRYLFVFKEWFQEKEHNSCSP
jgi:hypothetical protein